MGNANFCPVCGEIVGGWDDTELTPCKCDRERPDPLPTNSGAAYEEWLEDRIEHLERQVRRLQHCIRLLVDTYAWDVPDASMLTTAWDDATHGLEPDDMLDPSTPSSPES